MIRMTIINLVSYLVIYLLLSIFFNYVHHNRSLFESLEDTDCSSIQIECILTLLMIIKQIIQHHSTRRDDWIANLYTLLSFHSNSYLTTIIPMIYTILFTYTNDGTIMIISQI